MTHKKYYISVHDNQEGPFTLEELKNVQLSKETLIWYEGLENWKEAKEVAEFKELLISIPPPLPKTKENTKAKTIHTKASIKKEISVSRRKSKIAKELIFNKKILLVSLIIGILSFPIVTSNTIKAKYYKSIYTEEDFKSQMIQWKINDLLTKEEYSDIRYRDYEKENMEENQSYLLSIVHDFNAILEEKSRFKESDFGLAFAVFIISFLFLALGRYLYFFYIKSKNWIEENSTKKA